MGFGNSLISMYGASQSISLTIILAILGIIMIIAGNAKLNEKGWISTTGVSELETNALGERVGCGKPVQRKSYQPDGSINIKKHYPNSRYLVSVTHGGETHTQTLCFKSQSESSTIPVEFNVNTKQIRKPEFKDLGIVLIVIGAFMCLLSILFGICTFNKNCRSGLGAMGVMSSVFGGRPFGSGSGSSLGFSYAELSSNNNLF